MKTRQPWSLDPAAVGDQAILDLDRLARRPCHLLDGAVLVEPRAGLEFADGGQAGVHAGSGPDLASGREDVFVLEHVGVEIVGQKVAILLVELLSEAFDLLPKVCLACRPPA